MQVQNSIQKFGSHLKPITCWSVFRMTKLLVHIEFKDYKIAKTCIGSIKLKKLTPVICKEQKPNQTPIWRPFCMLHLLFPKTERLAITNSDIHRIFCFWLYRRWPWWNLCWGHADKIISPCSVVLINVCIPTPL